MAGTEIGRADLLIVPRFDNLTGTVNKALGSAGEAASKSGEGLGERTGSGFGKGLGSSGALVGVFASVTNKAMDAISSHVGSAAARFDTLNNYPKVMQSLGYSSDSAEASIAKMSDRLSTLPTRLDDMVSVVQGIVTCTGDLDQATDAGLALNDMLLASGSSTQLTSAAMEQFRQILSKGKPDMQDWRSLTSAMPGQMDQLAKSMLGPTANANDLYAALGGGKNEAILSMDDLLAAMIRLDTEGGDGFASFQEQAETACGGVQTSAENLSNAITKGITGTMDALGKENISGVMGDIKTGINDAFGTVNSVVGKSVPTLKSAWELVKKMAPSAVTAGVAFVSMTKGAETLGVLKNVATNGVKVAEAFSLARGGAGTLTESFKAVGLSVSPVTLGIGALSVAVGLGVSAYADWKAKTDALEKSTSGLNEAVARTTGLSDFKGRVDGVGTSASFSAKSVDELAESMSKSVDKINENTKSAEATIAQLNTAQQIVDDSIGRTDLSTEAQGRLQWALQTLNDQLGLNITSQDVLNGSYTDADGNVRSLRASLDDLVEAKKRDARVSAVSANLTEAYKDQSDAAATLADCQNKYNDAVDETMGMYPNWTREQAEASVAQRKVGKDLEAAKQQYDAATGAVDKFSAQLGDAAAATQQTDDALQSWANNTGPLFEAQLSSHGQSLSSLTDDLRALGASTDDLGRLTADQLEQLARDYDGTTTSIVADLEQWHVGMDDSAMAAAKAAGDIRGALDGMDGLGDRLSGVGVSVSDLSQKLAEAGVSTETLNQIGSENLGALAEACGGNMDAMVWYIQNYNATPIVDKDGNVSIDDASLIDAQGNVYTWNGSQIVDKDGNAAVNDTRLTDAQGNLWTWNGTALVSKDGSVTISENGVEKAISDRSNWNSGSWLDKAASATISVFRNVTDFFTGGRRNAAGGFRPHADGGFVPRLHAGGAIATRAVPLDIVGEAGAEAIVPLTNRKYSEPFARQIAEQMRDKGGITIGSINVDAHDLEDLMTVERFTDWLRAVSRARAMGVA